MPKARKELAEMMTVLHWALKVTYFYMLSPWLLIPFAIMVWISISYKYSNWEDDDYGPSFWKYLLPHSLIDCSVWPLALLSGLNGLVGGLNGLTGWANDPRALRRIGVWGDSLITAVVIFADTLAFTFLRQGHANIPLAAMVALAVGTVWRLALWKGFLKQDPEHFFTDSHPGHGMYIAVPGQAEIIIRPN